MKTTLRRLLVAWSLVIFLLLPALTRAETAVQAWAQRYHGPGNGYDYVNAMAVDSSNNVIVAGNSATIKYSGAGVPLWTNTDHLVSNTTSQVLAVDSSNNVIIAFAGGYYGCWTIKYSSGGGPLWTNRYLGPGMYGIYYVNAMAVDGSNNVIVTGSTGPNYGTIKYSGAGAALWTNYYSGPGYIENMVNKAYAVAVDGSNNVIVTGRSANTNDSYNYDYATIKYSSEGVPLWTNRYSGPGNQTDQANKVAVDGSNNVIVTGYSFGTESDRDYATIKYSSEGVPLWTNRYNGPGNGEDEATALAVDASNNVIVTGYSAGTNAYPYNYDYATIKYSSAGVPIWTNIYNGPGNGNDYASAVAVGSNNEVIVTGGAVGSTSDEDCTTIKYSSTGVPLWTNHYNGPENLRDYAVGMAVDRQGNVIVVGSSHHDPDNCDFATIKYICVPEPVMTGLQLTHGGFQLRVDDVLQPGTLVIEACTNLARWARVFTNTTPTNVLFYTDPDAGNRPARFYRALQFP